MYFCAFVSIFVQVMSYFRPNSVSSLMRTSKPLLAAAKANNALWHEYFFREWNQMDPRTLPLQPEKHALLHQGV
jgi:hypothetical protein